MYLKLADSPVINAFLGEVLVSKIFLGDVQIYPNRFVEGGKNLWKTTWEAGAYAWADGAKINQSNYIRSADLIPVIPNQPYAVSTNLAETPNQVSYWTKDRTYIKYETTAFVNRGYVLPPENCYFIAFNHDERKITPDKITWTQVEKGTVATDYEPPIM